MSMLQSHSILRFARAGSSARSGISISASCLFSVPVHVHVPVHVGVPSAGVSRSVSSFSKCSLPFSFSFSFSSSSSPSPSPSSSPCRWLSISSSSSSSSNSSSSPLRLRRALLYMPGSSPKMLAKATTLDVDTICMDLEDAVSPQKKAEARGHIVAALNAVPSAKQERMVRINPVGSGYEVEDLHTILSANVLPDGIVIPKVESPSHLRWVCDTIRQRIGQRGDSMRLIALIETTTAILSLPSIVDPRQGSSRLVALIFGADDYAASVGATRSVSNIEVSFARNMVLIHAKQAQLQAIDLVNISLSDEARLVEEAQEGAQWGYTGKQIIHPKQIEPVQKAFSPSAALIEWSSRVVSAASAASSSSGAGAFALDGQMIDAPTIKRARQIQEQARACGLLPNS